MSRITASMLIMLLVLGIAVPNAVLAETAAPQQVIGAVEFQGFEHLGAADQQRVKEIVKSKQGEALNPDTVTADEEAIRGLGWFYRVVPKVEPVTNGVKLVFSLVEWPVVTGVDFVGNTKLDGEQLAALVKTKAGEVLNGNRVSEDVQAVLDAYAKKGYPEPYVRIFQTPLTKDNVLQFHIREAKVSEVRIEGNTKTREEIIRRELLIRPGDVYNVNDAQKSLSNLMDLGIFDGAGTGISTDLGLEPGTIITTVHVKERRTGSAAFGVAQSNIQGLIGFVDVSDGNLFGTGQRASARVQFGAESSYQLSYSNPYLTRDKTSLTANVYDRSVLRQLVGPSSSVYDEKRQGGNLTLGRRLLTDTRGNDTRGFITMRADHIIGEPHDETVTSPIDVAAQTTGADPAPDTTTPPFPEELRRGVDVRSLALSAVRDTRNDKFLYPLRGSYTNFATEFAGFGGASFTKFTGELRKYWVVRQKKAPADETQEARATRERQSWVFASRLMGGTISGAPPFLEQFWTGGANTLRGYEEDRFPGKNMVLLSNELRVPINESLQLVGFADVGDAWGGQFADEYGDSSLKPHLGYGLGVRVVTPIGPLRLDYGFGEEGNQFHFGVGSSF